jgi:hypothetical protein
MLAMFIEVVLILLAVLYYIAKALRIVILSILLGSAFILSSILYIDSVSTGQIIYLILTFALVAISICMIFATIVEYNSKAVE